MTKRNTTGHIESELSEHLLKKPYEGPVAFARALLKDVGPDPDAFGCLIQALTKEGSIEEAIKEGEVALRSFPEDAAICHLTAWAYLGAEEDTKPGRTARARDLFTLAVSLQPSNPVYCRDLAEVYLINREAEKAVPLLVRAVRWCPYESDFLSRLALALLRTGRKEDALILSQRALKLADEEDAQAFDTCGMINLLVGDFESAGQLFSKATALYPDYGYFKSHVELLERERAKRQRIIAKGKKYEPLHARQKAAKRYFDEGKDPPPVLLDLHNDAEVSTQRIVKLSEGIHEQQKALEAESVASEYAQMLQSLGYEELAKRAGSEKDEIVTGSSDKYYLATARFSPCQPGESISVTVSVSPHPDGSEDWLESFTVLPSEAIDAGASCIGRSIPSDSSPAEKTDETLETLPEFAEWRDKAVYFPDATIDVAFDIYWQLGDPPLYMPRIEGRIGGVLFTEEIMGREAEVIRHFTHLANHVRKATPKKNPIGLRGIEAVLQLAPGHSFSPPYREQYGGTIGFLDSLIEGNGELDRDIDQGYEFAMYGDDDFVYFAWLSEGFETNELRCWKVSRKEMRKQVPIIKKRLIYQLHIITEHCDMNFWGFARKHYQPEAKAALSPLLLPYKS